MTNLRECLDAPAGQRHIPGSDCDVSGDIARRENRPVPDLRIRFIPATGSEREGPRDCDRDVAAVVSIGVATPVSDVRLGGVRTPTQECQA